MQKLSPPRLLKIAALVAAALSSAGALAAPGTPTISGYEIDAKGYKFVEIKQGMSGIEAYKDAVKVHEFLDVPVPFNIWNAANAVKAYAVVDGVRDDNSMVAMKQGDSKAAPVAHLTKGGKTRLQVDVCDARGNCERSTPYEANIFDTLPEFAGNLPDNAPPHQKHAIAKDTVVGTYFPTWGIYERKSDVSMMPVENLTHILYGFVPICGENASLAPSGQISLKRSCAGLPDYSVAIHDIWGEIAKTDLPGIVQGDGNKVTGVLGQMMAAKKRNPNLKVLPSIGGWTLSDRFYGLGDPANRKIFIDSVEKFLTTWKFFDGVDIDWEYPGGGGANPDLGNKDTDGQTYVTLMKELREMMTRLGKKTGKTYELTSAIGAAQSHIDLIDYKKATQYMNYLFDMTYDFSGAWTNTGLGHLSGLNAPSWMPDDPKTTFSVRNSVNALLAQGIDPKKLIVGTAMYGRGWTGVSDLTDPKNPFTGTAKGPLPENHAQYAWENGIIDYRGLKQFMLGADNKGINGFTAHYDAKAEAPYVFNAATGTLITYDNARSAIAKGNFVRDNKLGGLFSWDITGDTGDIMEAMHKGLDHPEGGGGDQPKAPTANAGQDIVVTPTGPAPTVIELDGSDSFNPQKDALKYRWEQIDGPTLAMTNADDVRTQISVPVVAADTIYVFKLTVTNAADLSSSSNVTITAKAQESHDIVAPRVTSMSAPATVGAKETATVKVHVDPKAGDKLEYKWSAKGLTMIGNGDTAQFVAPELTEDTFYMVNVVVTNSKGSDTGSVNIKVLKKEGGGVDPSIPPYKPNTIYQGGDKVTNAGGIYQCKPFPYSGWCGQAPAAYAPGTGFAWTDAWEKIGDVKKR